MENNRLIMYHKHSSSARVTFFLLNNSICNFDGLPADAKIVDSTIEAEENIDEAENLIANSKKELGLSEDILKVEKQFRATALSDTSTFKIYLAGFTTIDPPSERLADLGGKFITITEARSLPSVEIKLLGLVYSFLMD